MALFESIIVDRGSGSIGGITLSRNKGGNYIRAKGVPINPNTPAQISIRTLLAIFVDRWTNVLTQASRDGWETYAANVPLQGPLGSPRPVTGQNQYVRSQMARTQSGVPTVDDAPSIFDLGAFTETTITANEAGSQLNLSFLTTDAWANEDEAAMVVYGSRPQNPSINFFKGPFRLLGRIDGDAITPPVSPASFTSPFAYTVGQKVFARVVVTRADARMSNDQISNIIVIA